MFSKWPDMKVRLDIWHFMRRFASICTTEAHQLYPTFLRRLSSCIFVWSAKDVDQLKLAKHGQLQARNILHPTDEDVLYNISRKEMALHCRRFLLTSTRASDLHFQAYLMEGLVRWNKDRSDAAAKSGVSDINLYSGLQQHALNLLSEQVLGKKVYPTFTAPNKYTGELIGVEYLFNQTNQVLESTVDEGMEDEVAGFLNDEGYIEMDDLTQPPIPQKTPMLSCAERSTAAAAAKRLSSPPRPENLALEEETFPVIAEQQETSVGPDNIPGYEKVEALAEFLFRFREDHGIINQRDAKHIIDLLQGLEPYDKAVRRSERFKDRLVQGRFKTNKKSTVVPGVESFLRV
ncbi:uncharacterized protein LOC117120785 [Anneissia japonica]|uniref:uncharacterized protein LOC117120785 n=1 Tax=Anneissia japonica TaxID=1529436 RepID=UPI001425702D|nr:uncharacterized protein LOC117120785 [Anneissia japonica]